MEKLFNVSWMDVRLKKLENKFLTGNKTGKSGKSFSLKKNWISMNISFLAGNKTRTAGKGFLAGTRIGNSWLKIRLEKLESIFLGWKKYCSVKAVALMDTLN